MTIPVLRKLRTAFLVAFPLMVVLPMVVVLPAVSAAQNSGGNMAPMGAQAPGKPLPSPPAVAKVMLDGKPLTIHYNSPSMRGRVIMGGLVPYGKVWRTGANPATSFVTPIDLKIGDLNVPAGSYTLFTLPAEPGTPWMLIISKDTGEWGLAYKQGMDLGRTPMKSASLPAPQQVMSISFEKTTRKTTQLHIKWETTDEWVKIEAVQ